ncbi:MAG: UpxY family transcription antiterminator [Terracidiphilus sp.]
MALEPRQAAWNEDTVELAGVALAGETSAIQSRLFDQRQWFAVFTRVHHEKRVVERLTQRGIETFLPLYKVTHQWTHYRKVKLDLPLFPTYLFVNIAPHERNATIEVSGVLSLVGQGHSPAPLPHDEIDCLRRALQTRRSEPHSYLQVGTKVNITAGPLAGLKGIVVREKSGLRVVLSVELIRQSVAVEVDADELEPHGPCNS